MAGESILIVDDDERNRRLLRDVLTEVGYRIRDVVSGEDCLRAVDVELPAIILMDLQMPGIGGLGAAGRLAAHPRRQSFKVIALTASATFMVPSMQHDPGALANAGFDAMHTKPVDLAALLELIGKLLSERGS